MDSSKKGQGSKLKGALVISICCVLTAGYAYYDVEYAMNFPTVVSEQSPRLENYTEAAMEERKKGYVVWNPSCKIPDIDPHHESIRSLIKKWKPISCSKKKAITAAGYDDHYRSDGKGANFVTILPEAWKFFAKNKGDKKKKSVFCCYSSIKRKTEKKYRGMDDDNHYELKRGKCFKNKTYLPPDVEFVHVYCDYGKNNGKWWLNEHSAPYKHMHAVIVDKERRQRGKPLGNDSAYSVLLFGIDSISRLNFIRSMPKTAAFVRDWNTLEGYTKMGDNTIPNLMAILTGFKEERLRKTCWKSRTKPFDDCPFLWKEFHKKGYATAYMEDEPTIGTFNYHKYGFLKAPTDYYTRPYMLAGEHLLKTKIDGEMHYCTGMQPSAEYLFDYVEKLAGGVEGPYFALLWLNSFSHNKLNQPAVMDERVETFLRRLEPRMESTILVFFSDHGIRFGKIRETFVGWHEERMPFIYVKLPDSFKKRYPGKYENLRKNRNRLTSPFDLHVTLKELLNGEDLGEGKGAADCPDCRSLFSLIPWNRSCEDAGITRHWCTCNDDEREAVSIQAPVVESATNFAVKYINNYVRKKGHDVRNGTQCAFLTLKRVISVRYRSSGGLFGTKPREYVVVFETGPNEGIFESTIRLQEGRFDISDSISRINAYGAQSKCAMDANLKKYCFCVDMKEGAITVK